MTSSSKRLVGLNTVGSLSKQAFLRVFANTPLVAPRTAQQALLQLGAVAPKTEPDRIRSAFRLAAPVAVVVGVVDVVPTVITGVAPPITAPPTDYAVVLVTQDGGEINIPVEKDTGNLLITDTSGATITIAPTAPPPDGVFEVLNTGGEPILITFKLVE